MDLWREVLGRYIDPADCPTILDLGAGTGAYSEFLGEAFEATVLAVEPSERMRQVAQREHAHPRVTYLAGRAEVIPLEPASCDAALLSNVVHHVTDRDACAAELQRVLRPGGLVLVRGTLAGGRLVPFMDFFPSARANAARRIPTPEQVVEMFATGFEHVASELIDQESSPSFRDYYERVKLRAISTLELVSDEEFERGIEAMREVAEAETEATPVIEQVDLIVFRRR
jgi:ubiquinone/menaquinone biosynthesis C-methylase UbiE